jgi:preprotein translocase subunit Sec63
MLHTLYSLLTIKLFSNSLNLITATTATKTNEVCHMATILKKLLIAPLLIASGWVTIGCTSSLDYLDREEEAVIKACYDLLRVDGPADHVTIRKAHNKLALKYHPDKTQDETIKKRHDCVMKGLNKAREILEAVLETTEKKYKEDENWQNEYEVLIDALDEVDALDAKEER